MPRTLSTPTSTATANRITQPGYLAKFGFSFPIRYSSRGDVVFNGETYIAANMKVGQQAQQPNGAVSLSIEVGNSDRTFGALCLAEPPQEKAVTVWKFYEGATAAGDPVQIFNGAIDSVDSITEESVKLQLSSLNFGTLFIPRRRINAASGFNHLMPAGRIIVFDGLKIDVSRDVQ